MENATRLKPDSSKVSLNLNFSSSLFFFTSWSSLPSALPRWDEGAKQPFFFRLLKYALSLPVPVGGNHVTSTEFLERQELDSDILKDGIKRIPLLLISR